MIKKKQEYTKTPFGMVPTFGNVSPCKACQLNEVRAVVYSILYALPSDLVSEFAQEHLALTAVANSPEKED